MLKYLFQDLNIVVEYLAFLISFFGPEHRDKQKINRKMFPILALFFVGIYSLHFIYWSGKDQVAWMLAIWAFCMSYILFDICTKNLVVWGIGIFLMIALLENMWNVILFRLIDDIYIGMNIGVFLSTVFSIAFGKVNKGKERMLSELSIKEWLNVDAILMVITFMMTFFSVIVAEITFYSARIAGEVIIVAGSIAIIVLLFQLLFMYEKKVDYKVQEEISKKAALMQKQYFEKILEKEDDTRAFRHELINELLNLKMNLEKGEYSSVKHYIEEMLGDIQKIKNKVYDVGNDAVNTILNYYLPYNDENVQVSVEGKFGSNLNIDERDLCVLSSNLIKNALEAVEKQEIGKIWIEIRQGKLYAYMKVKNTYNERAVKKKNALFITTKKDKKNHGYGIRKMIEVIEKYGGEYQFGYEDEEYVAEVWLKYKKEV